MGAEWAGLEFDGHYFSEVDDYAIKVYERRFPGAVPLGDITKVDGRSLPPGEWIIAGGFPCQDISVAGKGAGLAGKRSGLWFEYARLVGELRPRYAIMENVGALTFRGLDAVLGSLAEIGYDAEWQDIRASDVGAPHRRERIWIVAYPMRDGRAERGAERQGQLGGLASLGSSVPMGNPNGQQCQEQLDRLAARAGDADGKHGGEIVADAPDGRDVRRDRKLEPAQGQVRVDRRGPEDGRREWWAAEPNVGRVAHGIPSRVDRLKCLGNAIVPQIAAMIFRGLIK